MINRQTVMMRLSDFAGNTVGEAIQSIRIATLRQQAA